MAIRGSAQEPRPGLAGESRGSCGSKISEILCSSSRSTSVNINDTFSQRSASQTRTLASIRRGFRYKTGERSCGDACSARTKQKAPALEGGRYKSRIRNSLQNWLTAGDRSLPTPLLAGCEAQRAGGWRARPFASGGVRPLSVEERRKAHR